MGDIVTTVVGRMTNEAIRKHLDGGREVVTFRMACNHRYFDRAAGLWKEASTSFVTVDCWRHSLGRNVMASFGKGDPVIVHGRMVVREYDQGGRPRTVVTLVADAVGPDLNYAMAAITRTKHTAAPNAAEASGAEGTEEDAAGVSAVGVSEVPWPSEPGDSGPPEPDGEPQPAEDGGAGSRPAELQPAASVR